MDLKTGNPSQRTKFNLESGPKRTSDGLYADGAFSRRREARVDVNADRASPIVDKIADESAEIDIAGAEIISCSHMPDHFYDYEVVTGVPKMAQILRPDGTDIFKYPDMAKMLRLLDENYLRQEFTALSGSDDLEAPFLSKPIPSIGGAAAEH